MIRNDKLRAGACGLLLWAGAPGMVQALSLGDVQMRSYLLEPLRAEIPLRGVTPVDVDDLKIRLAPDDAFERFGIDRSNLHRDLRFEIESRGDQWVVVVRSRQPVREPFISFPLSAAWRDGQLLREYTLFVDPRPLRQAATVSRPIPPQTRSAAAAEPAPQAGPARDVYGPVARGETAWLIAQRLKPAGVTTEQMLMALQRVNPDAFAGGNVNNLRAGAVLRVPGAQDLAAYTPSQARAAFQAQNEAWRHRGRVAASTPPVVEDAAPGRAEPPARPLPVDKPVPAEAPPAVADAPSPDSELRILREDPQRRAAPSAEQISLEKADLERRLLLTLESAEATRLEFQSLNEEVNRMTEQMEQMQRLLQLKERQIAALTAIQQETSTPERATAVAAPSAALAAATAAPVGQADPPAVVRVEAAARPVSSPDLLQNWWLALVVVGLLVAILVLLVLLWRRSPRRVRGGGPGAIPDQERPYAKQVAAYSVAGVGAAGATDSALDTGFTGSDAQRFLDELERSYGDDGRFEDQPAKLDADLPDEEFQVSDADLAALGADVGEGEIDRWTGKTASGSAGQDNDDEINSILNDLAAELDDPAAEEAMREPVISTDDELPGIDLPLDLDVLEGVEHDNAGQATRPGAVEEDIGLTRTAPAEEDDAEAMDLKLELARAYLEIGDVEGARDILGKVVESSMSGEQLEQARALLKALK